MHEAGVQAKAYVSVQEGQERNFNIFLGGCHRLCPAKMKSIINELAIAFSVIFLHGSSKLPFINKLYCRFCPVKWQIFKVG